MSSTKWYDINGEEVGEVDIEKMEKLAEMFRKSVDSDFWRGRLIAFIVLHDEVLAESLRTVLIFAQNKHEHAKYWREAEAGGGA